MIRETVAVGEEPTRVCAVHWRHAGIVLVNSGAVDVVVDVADTVAVDGDDAGIRVAPGQTVTVPAVDPDRSLAVWAVTAGGLGEITYVAPR